MQKKYFRTSAVLLCLYAPLAPQVALCSQVTPPSAEKVTTYIREHASPLKAADGKNGLVLNTIDLPSTDKVGNHSISWSGDHILLAGKVEPSEITFKAPLLEVEKTKDSKGNVTSVLSASYIYGSFKQNEDMSGITLKSNPLKGAHCKAIPATKNFICNP